MRTSDFDYDLPQNYIAQTPLTPRDASRLMVLNRQTGTVQQHAHFRDLGQFLQPNDLLVLNQTRVIPARLFARKIPTGGKVEILLLKRVEPQVWECLVGGKGLVAGKRVQLEAGPAATILSAFNDARRLIRFDAPLRLVLNDIGQMPLPPYIHEKLNSPERYQTVYAQDAGSAAAPTAGLHFTPALLAQLKGQGVQVAAVTLHVGLDTFAPVTEDDPQAHVIHSEWCEISAETVAQIRQTKAAGGRVIAVGTTSVRTLESAAARKLPADAYLRPFAGPTDLFILPGYSFQVVDGMITNFHLPKSTLIMLVSAFVGREAILRAYEIAKQENYRFFSFGDAMLLL